MKFLIISLALAASAWAQTPTKFQTDILQFGRGASLLPKELIFDAGDGGSNKKFSLDPSDNQLDLNTTLNITGGLTATGNVSTSTLTVDSTSTHESGLVLGDGTNADRSLTVNRTAFDPYIQWDETLDKWVFSNDGSIEKPLGSGSGSGDGGINLLVNPSFEDGITVDWTFSGGTFSGQTFTNPKPNDATYARFIATISGEYFESVAKLIPDFFQGGCLAYGYYKTTDNNAFALHFYSAGSSINSITLPTTNGLWLKTPALAVLCPGTGVSVKMRVESLAAGTIEFDSAYLGNENRVVFPGCQGILPCEDLLSAKVSSTDVVSDETLDWITGDCTNATTGRATCNFVAGTFTVAPNCSASSTGAASSAGIISVSASAVTVFTVSGVSDINSSFELKCQKRGADFTASNPQTAVTNEQSGWFIDANIGGSAPSLGVANVASYTEITDAGLDMVLNDGSAPAKIPCSATNASTGLTCSAGSEGLGAVFFPPFTGYFDVCTSFGKQLGAGSGIGIDNTFQLVLTGNASQTILQEGGERAAYREIHSSSITSGSTHNVCGTFKFDDTSEKTVRIMYEQLITGVPSSNVISINRDGSTGQRDLRITVKPSTMNIARAVLTGDQVVSKGGVRAEVASVSYGTTSATTVCSASPCSFFDQIGTPATQVTRASAGSYSLVFGAVYSRVKCSSSCSLAGGSNCYPVTNIACYNCSSVPFITSNAAGAATDSHGSVNCTMVP